MAEEITAEQMRAIHAGELARGVEFGREFRQNRGRIERSFDDAMEVCLDEGHYALGLSVMMMSVIAKMTGSCYLLAQLENLLVHCETIEVARRQEN